MCVFKPNKDKQHESHIKVKLLGLNQLLVAGWSINHKLLLLDWICVWLKFNIEYISLILVCSYFTVTVIFSDQFSFNPFDAIKSSWNMISSPVHNWVRCVYKKELHTTAPLPSHYCMNLYIRKKLGVLTYVYVNNLNLAFCVYLSVCSRLTV